MKSATPILEARDLSVKRGSATLLQMPALSLTPGEFFFIIGPNGAGKSTLLLTLAFLLHPFEGQIFFQGRKVGAEMPVLQYRRKTALVFQEPLLFDATVYQNIASGLKIRGLAKKQIEPVVLQSLERFGILRIRDRSARTLSGGEARRVSLARALATGPEILFLDEAFSALDPLIRESLIQDLSRVLRETAITAVFVTHDREEAFRLADRLCILQNGSILQLGPPTEIRHHPKNELVASLVGIETILQGQVIRKQSGAFIVSVHGREIKVIGEATIGDEIVICIRPEDIRVAVQPPQNSSDNVNLVTGKIESITPLGPFKKVRIDCGFPLTAFIADCGTALPVLEKGMEVTAVFDATVVHVMS